MGPQWCPQQLQQQKQLEQSPKTFRVASYNSTSWQSAKKFLQETPAEVVLLQESHVCDHEASASARK